MVITAWADPENSVSRVPENVFIYHQCISQRGELTSLKKQLDLLVQLLLEGVLTSTSKETYGHLCLSRGGSHPPISPPCPPSGSAHSMESLPKILNSGIILETFTHGYGSAVAQW